VVSPSQYENRAPQFAVNFSRLIRPETADLAPQFYCRDLFRSA
jgi:hypothetical protein